MLSNIKNWYPIFVNIAFARLSAVTSFSGHVMFTST